MRRLNYFNYFKMGLLWDLNFCKSQGCGRIQLCEVSYTLKNQKLKITQLEKARFIKVNELKLTEVELL